jgi:MFS superfamily sulfate permease-like transporter
VAFVKGPFTFGAANGMVRKILPTIEAFDVAVVDLTDVEILDDNAALAIEEMLDKAKDMCRCEGCCTLNDSWIF